MAAAPVIVLVRPQLGENIGAAARAMANCGLAELRLVGPRDGWPNYRAVAAASGADAILDAARLFDSAAAAVEDLHHLWATTARPRDQLKPVSSPRLAVRRMRRALSAGERCGVLFGPERTGLTNEELNLCDAVLTFPLNPGFSSLNLAQAVLLVAYLVTEPDDASDAEVVVEREPGHAPAAHGQIERFFRHLEQELDRHGFLHHAQMRPTMVRNLRNIFLRADLRDQEVRVLHGVVSALSGFRLDGSVVPRPDPRRPEVDGGRGGGHGREPSADDRARRGEESP